MSQSAELGLDRAEHPVIRVACVASRIGRHAMILSFATIRFFAVICQTVKAPLVLRCPPRFGAQVKSSRFRRKPSANGAASVGARIDITTNGRKMPAYKGKLTDDQIKWLLHDWCY